jgi:hypothetical protein
MLSAVQAIEAMVAPVVLITTSGLLANGIVNVYGQMGQSLRDLVSERLVVLGGPSGEVLTREQIHDIDKERLAGIEAQLPMMLRRQHRLRDSFVVVYCSIGVFALSVIALAIAVLTGTEADGLAALCLVLAGTVLLLCGVVLAVRALARTFDPFAYAVQRTGLNPPQR